jgi:8-oxo-(d)GTP phosphatase
MRRATREIQAAGVVVFRPGREVLVVHRPKYDDWSFPKGKLDRGEIPPVAAVREVEEETGLRVGLQRPLRPQRYPIRDGRKLVHYWVGRVVPNSDDDVSDYVREGEIDQVRWLPIDVALKQLTYPRDRATLREALEVRKRTTALIVLRHAESWSRRAWHADDRRRPLIVHGRKQAQDLVPLLAAYDVRRVVTSSSTRCVETITPYVDQVGVPWQATATLSEEGATTVGVRDLVVRLAETLRSVGSTVVCSHRPVLPVACAALGVADPQLEKGSMVVLHVRKGRVRAVERY